MAPDDSGRHAAARNGPTGQPLSRWKLTGHSGRIRTCAYGSGDRCPTRLPPWEPTSVRSSLNPWERQHHSPRNSLICRPGLMASMRRRRITTADLACGPAWPPSPKMTRRPTSPASGPCRAGFRERSRITPAGCTLIGVTSPIRGDLTSFRVQVSDTVIPHIARFPGMPDCHPGAGCRQRRATGVLCLPSPFGVPGFLPLVSLPSG